MKRISLTILAITAALSLFSLTTTRAGVPAVTEPSTQPSSQPAAVDLANTNCVVTGEPIGDSKLTEVYEGKIYHFCCDDCPIEFKKDPAKYAKAVAADPVKYGVKAAK